MHQEVKIIIGSSNNRFNFVPDFYNLQDWWDDISTSANLIEKDIKYKVYLLPGVYDQPFHMYKKKDVKVGPCHYYEICPLNDKNGFYGELKYNCPIFKSKVIIDIPWTSFSGVLFDSEESFVFSTTQNHLEGSVLQNCGFINLTFNPKSYESELINFSIIRNNLIANCYWNCGSSGDIKVISGDIIYNNLIFNCKADAFHKLKMQALYVKNHGLARNNVFCDILGDSNNTNCSFVNDDHISNKKIIILDLVDPFKYDFKLKTPMEGIDVRNASSNVWETAFKHRIRNYDQDIQGKVRNTWNIGPFN